MATERSDKLFEIVKQAEEKYDYFLASVAAAIAAYLGQNFAPKTIRLFSPAALEALSVLLFIGAFVAAIRRIERTKSLLEVNQRFLRISEEIGELTHAALGPPALYLNRSSGELLSATSARGQVSDLENLRNALRQQVDDVGLKGARWTQVRDALLILAFASLISSRLWAAILAGAL